MTNDSADERTIRTEAETLRTLLERLLPEYPLARTDVSLPADAPALVRVFWDVIGYSTAFRPFVHSPDEAWGRREAQQILDGWRAKKTPRSPLDKLRAFLRPPETTVRNDQLPARFRFVGVSERWDAFYVTDERAGVGDPPVVAITRDPPSVRREHSSYLRKVSQGLIEKALNVSGCELSVSPPLKGEPVLPNLAPELVSVAEGIWQWSGGTKTRLGFASWDRLCEFMHGAPIESITHFHTTNGCFVPIKMDMKPAVVAASRMRTFRWSEQTEMVGWIDEIPAWITLDAETETLTGVSVSNANRDRMLAWIDEHIAGGAEAHADDA